MTINWDLVQNGINGWLTAQVPGTPVIRYEPNAPRPIVPYITQYLNSIVAINQDWTDDETNVANTLLMKGDRQFTIQLQAYGGDPETVLENIRTSLQKQTVLDTLRAIGIAYFQSYAVTDISELVNSRYERRAQLDILFGIGQIYFDNPGYFQETDVSGIVYDEVGTIVYNETINIKAP